MRTCRNRFRFLFRLLAEESGARFLASRKTGEHDQGEAKPWVEFGSFWVECHLKPLLLVPFSLLEHNKCIVPGRHFIRRWNMIVRGNVVRNRTVVDSN